ncbi:hypothetical protein DSO57_1015313 [Entomophthora muscae]|uniref:Uncharacterized protein n=1 Tax=Entomophthora muscae TaxID=34485 RepID=A0ACC2TH02_9FUNG|nr:hypothetical protein DSO57_1015313 [Entomophthora muscae]
MQPCTIDLRGESFIAMDCIPALNSNSLWTGDAGFAEDLTDVKSAHATDSTKILKALKLDLGSSYIRNLNQGIIAHSPERLSRDFDCFRNEICVVEATWTKHLGWTVTSTPTVIESVPKKAAVFGFKPTPTSLRYQVAFFGRATCSLWTQTMSWHVSYTVETHSLVERYPQSNFTTYNETFPLFRDHSKPRIIIGYTYQT